MCIGGVPVRGLGSSRVLRGGVAGPVVDGAGDDSGLIESASVPSKVSRDGACVKVVLRSLVCSLGGSDHMQMQGSWSQMKHTRRSSTSSQ